MRELRRLTLCSTLVLAPSLWAQDLNEALFKGDPRVAMRVCAERALQAKPTELAFMVGRGAVHLAEGEIQKAEAMFVAAEGAHGKDGETYLRLARAWKRAGRMDMLPGLYRKLLAQDPGHEDALVGFVGLLLEGGFPKEAQECGERLFAKEPKEWELHIPIGKAWLKAGQKEAAAEWFARAAAAGRKKEEMWRSIAKAVAETLPRGGEGSPKAAPPGPAVPERPDKAFFMQDARDLVAACVTASRALIKSAPECEEIAELGMAMMAAGDRAKAEEIFIQAEELGYAPIPMGGAVSMGPVMGGMPGMPGMLAGRVIHRPLFTFSPGYNAIRRFRPGVYQNIGSAWVSQGHIPDGLAAFRFMREADPKASSSGPLTGAASSLLLAGYEAEANEFMELAWKADPREDVYLEFARKALSLGRQDLAALWMARVAAPKDPKVLHDIAEAFLEKPTSGPIQAATRPALPQAPQRWFMAPLVPTGKAMGEFKEEDLQGVAKAVADCQGGMKRLEGLKSIGDLAKEGSPFKDQLKEEDVILSLEEINLRMVKASKWGSATWFPVVSMKVGLYTGKGILIRNLHFLDAGKPSFFGSYKENLSGMQKSVVDFITSPVFDLWAR